MIIQRLRFCVISEDYNSIRETRSYSVGTS